MRNPAREAKNYIEIRNVLQIVRKARTLGISEKKIIILKYKDK